MGSKAGERSWNPIFVVELQGDSRSRGIQHGRALKQPIQAALDFYRRFFAEHLGLDAATMRKRARQFLAPTARISGDLIAEYEGIAEGSGQTLEDILALSGRYEITFDVIRVGECSNIFVGSDRSMDQQSLLGMNWDWRPEVLDFRAILIAHCDDMPDYITITECGQPFKYGLNSSGIGCVETGMVCSNSRSVGDQLFVTVVKHALAQTTLAEARKAIVENPPEATISFLLADESGRGCSLEATPTGVTSQDLGPDDLYWHTSHCLHRDDPHHFEDSYVRGRRLESLLSFPGVISRQTVGRWLANTTDGNLSVCRRPDPALIGTASWVQTLCSMVLDLRGRTLWVSDGPACDHPFCEYTLS
jgi:isopenicillin-N N-acyltransferase-like protein